MRHEENESGFLKGAIIGGVLGSAVSLLAAPKSGRELRDDITDGYNKITEEAHSISDQLKDRGYHLLHPFEEEEEESGNYTPFVVGGALGVTIGAVAAFLLYTQSGKRLRKNLNNQYENLYDRAEDFVADLNDRGQDALERIDDWKHAIGKIANKLNSKGKRRSKVEEILDWAGLGLDLIHQFKKRR